MTRLLFLVALLSQLPGVLCSVNTDKEWTVFEGKSITVPCYYMPEYTVNVKYWCYGSVYDFCSSLARTDKQDNAPSSNEKITIADDPTQHMFTVTMRELKETDSGWYWCGVERGGIWSTDSTTSVYISVIQGISVVNREVSAEEGDSVTVQYHYSKKHRQNDKKWCRSGHLRSCSVTNNGTFISESLLINDDRKDTVTVTMKHLEMRDAGWYFCGAGEHQVSVYVLVTPRSTTSALRVYTQNKLTDASVKAQNSNSYMVQCLLIVCGSLIFLLTAVLGTRRIMRGYRLLNF